MASTMTTVIDNFVAPPCSAEIDILFRDAHLMLINKPSGLLSLSGKNPLNLDSVHYRLRQQWPTVTLLHRLDLGTSGIMLLALNKAANGNLTRQFQNRSITKTYTCVLAGHLAHDSGRIDAPIGKDPALFPRLKVCAEIGKAAVSDYQVLARLNNPPRTRVLFTPLTGRTHQLRIHSAELGHPIAGCDLYGDADSLALADRLQLHASSLTFDHPVSGETIHWECACPF